VTEGLEVEVKLAVDDPERIRALVSRPDPQLLAGFTGTGPVREIDVVDRYLDTAGQAL
jgi:hypothetical protein